MEEEDIKTWKKFVKFCDVNNFEILEEYGKRLRVKENFDEIFESIGMVEDISGALSSIGGALAHSSRILQPLN